MRQINLVVLAALIAAALHSGSAAAAQDRAATDADRAGCEALLHLRNLTVTHAGLSATDRGSAYCYVKGILPPAIHFHVQLPLPRDWNGRFLKWGDGGKDGDLDFADHRVAEGYAVANSRAACKTLGLRLSRQSGVRRVSGQWWEPRRHGMRGFRGLAPRVGNTGG